jgi:acyl dehydratase
MVTEVVPPRPEVLVSDLVRWAGGDPQAWKGTIPPYMFPQWGFPALGRTLDGVPYPLAKVLNQGCRIEVHAPLPMAKALTLNAHLHGVDDNGSRARIHQRLSTTVDGQDTGLTADVFAFVPLAKRKKDGPKRAPPIVPPDAEEIGRRELASTAGLDFARLTGDFNPVHWIGPYARMAGFPGIILHGFATAAIATEAVIAARWNGDALRLKSLEVRFTRPLVLPASVGVFLSPPDTDGRIPIAVGTTPGGEAAMLGHIEARPA